MHNYNACRSRLKSRKSFINTSTALTKTPKEIRLELWMNNAPNTFPLKPSGNLASDNKLKWPIWRVLNRLRTGVGRSKSNLKWRYIEDELCECGATQTLPHLFECPNSLANILNLDELFISSEGAVELARFWSHVWFLGCRTRRRRSFTLFYKTPNHWPDGLINAKRSCNYAC